MPDVLPPATWVGDVLARVTAALFADHAFGPDEGHWVTIDGEHVLIRGPRPGHVPTRAKIGGPEHLAAVGAMANERQRTLTLHHMADGTMDIHARLPYTLDPTGRKVDAATQKERDTLKAAGFHWEPVSKSWAKTVAGGKEQKAGEVRSLLARDYATLSSGGLSPTAHAVHQAGLHHREANIVVSTPAGFQAAPHDRLAEGLKLPAPAPGRPDAGDTLLPPSLPPIQRPPAQENTAVPTEPVKLPVLVGSPKQVSWATDIRRQHMDAMRKHLAPAHDSDREDYQAGRLSADEAAVHSGNRVGLQRWMQNQQQAGLWIDRRYWSPQQWEHRYASLVASGQVKQHPPNRPPFLDEAPPAKTAPVPSGLTPPMPAPAPAKPVGTKEYTVPTRYKEQGPQVGDVGYDKASDSYHVVTRVKRDYIPQDFMSFGGANSSDTLGEDRGWLHHVTARPATAEESAPRRARREAEQTRQAATTRVNALAGQIKQHGERHDFDVRESMPKGDVLLDRRRFDIGTSRGDYFVVGPEQTWHIQSDPDHGDFGHRVPTTAELSDELRVLHAQLKGAKPGTFAADMPTGGDEGDDTFDSVNWPLSGRWTGDEYGIEYQDSDDDDAVIDRSELPGADTAGFAEFSVPTPVKEEAGLVYRRGPIFVAGDYPDKRYSMTPEEIRAAAADFDGPIDLDIEHAPSILDHKLGQLVSVDASEDGQTLFGLVALPKWLDDVIGPAARKVSASWDRATKRLVGLALVVRPRVADAALMSAFSAATEGGRMGQAAFADWSQAEQDDFPDSSFLVVLPGGKKDASGKTTPRDLRKLPVRDASGKLDLPHLRNAISRLGQPDTDVPDKEALQKKAQRMLDEATADHSGMRHSASDRADMQTIHDIATRQGAECAPEQPADKGGTSDMSETIEQGIQQGMMKRFFAWFAAGAPEPGQAPATPTPTAPATFAADPAPAPDAEKERLRAEVAKLRAQQVADRAATFAKEQMAAGKAFPAQHDAIVAAYSAAAVDDSQHGAVNFGDHTGSRVEALTALFAAAPSHGLTQEAIKVPADQLTRLPSAGQLAGTASAKFSEDAVDPKEVVRLLGFDPVGKTILRDMAQRANGILSGKN